jgi:hypothetical protein
MSSEQEQEQSIEFYCVRSEIYAVSSFGSARRLTELLQNPFVNSHMVNCALEKACYHGHPDIVACLLQDPRLDLSFYNRDYHPLKSAVENGYMNVVELLLQDQRFNPETSGALELARENSRKAQRMVDLLLGINA